MQHIQTEVHRTHSEKLKRRDRMATRIIWLLAVLTIAILAWIVGYILFKGLWKSNLVTRDTAPIIEKTVSLFDRGGEFVIIVHKSVDIDVLDVTQLSTLYNKARRENWGFYTQQDIKAYPVVLDTSDPYNRAMYEFLLQNTEKTSFPKTVTHVHSWDEMMTTVASQKGGIGYVPAVMAESLPRSVRRLSVRRYGLAVHPSVQKIENNRSLQAVSEKDMKSVLAGAIKNWKDIGGIDLPLVLVIDRSIPQPYRHTAETVSSIIYAADKDELYAVLQRTPGAVGITDMRSARGAGFSVLPVVSRESGWNLTPRYIFSAPARSGQWGGISYIIINTFFLILFTLIFSTPIGIMAAVYLVEYAKSGRFVNLLRMGTETLAGVPSIVFGLFGFVFFVGTCGFGIGFISSTLTVTLMVLPTIIRTSEEALKSVPQSLRDASFGLGANKLQTVMRIIIPSAAPGILTGVILAIGRTVGETAAILYTLGSNYDLVSGPSSSARVLSLHLYLLFSEAISFDKAFASGAVLITIILVVNILTTQVIGGLNKNAAG